MKKLLKAVFLAAFMLLLIPTVSAKAAPTITVSGYSQPTNIYKGNVFILKGTISSTSTITNVNVRIKNNSTGAYEINKSLANSSTSFSLSKIDPYIEFNKLTVGSKTFEIRVTSGGVTQTVKSNVFNVLEKVSMSVSGYTAPPATMNKGSVHIIRGKITSTSTITNAGIRIKNNSTGKYEINKSLSNSSSTFDLGKLDNYITFGVLTTGSKTIEIYATSGGVTQTVRSDSFKVVENVSMSISGYVAPPSTMKVGGVHIIKGKIASTTTITSAGIRIKNNSTGKYEIDKSLSNSSSTFDLGRLDNYITFNTLTTGSKTIEVYATSGGVFKILASNNFTVSNSGTEPQQPSSGLMMWPVPSSCTLSSCYMDGRNHYALDIVGASGAQVVSSCSGKVVAVNKSCTHNYAKSSSCGCGGGFGNYVVVESNEGGTVKYVRYSHLASVSVSNGQAVSRGTEIGKIGSTGAAQGFHLDYKMYKSGGYSGNTYCVDPTYYVQVPRGINANAATTQCCYDYVRDLKKRLGYN